MNWRITFFGPSFFYRAAVRMKLDDIYATKSNGRSWQQQIEQIYLFRNLSLDLDHDQDIMKNPFKGEMNGFSTLPAELSIYYLELMGNVNGPASDVPSMIKRPGFKAALDRSMLRPYPL
jgi:hypothetical protein